MPSKQQLKTKTGFTIIEVVLVLAIAGLIFLMVFVALPALQRSQRDTQRRQDISRLASALTQYQTNNDGSLPDSSANGTSGDAFQSSYLTGDFVDPSGTAYTVMFYKLAANGTGAAKDNPEISVYTNAYCNGETPTYKAGANNYAAIYKLEGITNR